MTTQAVDVNNVSTEDLAIYLHTYLLPQLTATAQSYQDLAIKLQQVACHLQHMASNMQNPLQPDFHDHSNSKEAEIDLELQNIASTTQALPDDKPLSRKQRKRLGGCSAFFVIWCCCSCPVGCSSIKAVHA